MDQAKTGSERAIIALTAFLNFFGLTLAFPVFVPLVAAGAGMLAPEITKEMRGVILGVLLGVYPLVQFFTAPMLGVLSDRHGRKPILILAAAGNIIGNLILAFGVFELNVWIVLLGRVMTGCFSGALAVTQSAMSDISDPASRPKNFGLLGAMFGASLALGPAIGGILSDHTHGGFFTLATPFLAAALLAFVNLALLVPVFIETLSAEHRQHSAFHILTGPKNFVTAFVDSKSRSIFLVVFLLFFGFNFFTQFFQYYLVERFQITNTQFGMLFGYIGIWSILVQGFLTKPVSKRFPPGKVLRVTLLGLALVFPIILLVPSYWLLYAVVFVIPLMNGLSIPNITSIVSGLADRKNQGRILGVNQSVQAVSQFLSPLIGGYLVGINYTMPIWVSFAFILAAWLAFIPCYNQQCTE